MLTKKECEKALENIANLELQEYEGLYGRIKYVGDIRFCDYRLLRRLIKEHFDNPPLKFEELKEGMFVWDNNHHTYIKIDRIWESYNKTIYFYAIGWECCENTEYEPNRFYRKEVQE